MKFNEKTISEILSEYPEEDFDNQVKVSIPVTSVMMKNLNKVIEEYGTKESPVFIASKAIALYIELIIKNDHAEKDMVYYYLHERLEIDKTGLKEWKLYNMDVWKNFLKYAENYFQHDRFEYDMGDFFKDLMELSDFKKYLKYDENHNIWNVRFKV